MQNNLEEQTQEQMQNLENELETIKSVCYDYKKRKSLNIQIITSIFALIILYSQQYILNNNIDIGFSHTFIIYIGICCILTILLGWISYILEFHINNEKIFKIGQYIVWGIEIIAIIIFLILLFV